MGTGVYKWPIGLATDIAARKLLKSKFVETIVSVMDERTKHIYDEALLKLHP
tara:strand:- start:1 stop:156 length:156 start_codon:yes stop_codon:yes gene_type:complete